MNNSETGATAIALLTFLAGGQTHQKEGRYKGVEDRGVTWLIKRQQSDGDLANGAAKKMFSQALATLALCEAYGLSGDKRVGTAAQHGVDFIIAAQNKVDGGWGYNSGVAGDTCDTCWQVCALKSAESSGLKVAKNTFLAAGKWFDGVSVADGREFSYQAGMKPTASMTAAALFCRQLLGVPRKSRSVEDGVKYILAHEPDKAHPDVYYWFFATQYMHLVHRKYYYEWQAWCGKINGILARTQNTDEKCADGSWDPSNDIWGKEGGRLMETTLAALTLEVRFRYLGLFKLDTVEPQR